MKASGRSGELRHGYQKAADIGRWQMAQAVRFPPTFVFVGTLDQTNEYWIRERPLDLVVSLGSTEWQWKNVTPIIDGARIEIELTRRPDVVGRA